MEPADHERRQVPDRVRDSLLEVHRWITDPSWILPLRQSHRRVVTLVRDGVDFQPPETQEHLCADQTLPRTRRPGVICRVVALHVGAQGSFMGERISIPLRALRASLDHPLLVWVDENPNTEATPTTERGHLEAVD